MPKRTPNASTPLYLPERLDSVSLAFPVRLDVILKDPGATFHIVSLALEAVILEHLLQACIQLFYPKNHQNFKLYVDIYFYYN